MLILTMNVVVTYNTTPRKGINQLAPMLLLEFAAKSKVRDRPLTVTHESYNEDDA